MDLDHFIFFHDVATPAILNISPSAHLRKKDEKSTADSPGYPLDQSHPSGVPHRNNRPGIPFQLDALNIDRSPIITSASPFQQSLSFSPSNPLLLYYGPLSAVSNNASRPSSLNSTDFYSPSGSLTRLLFLLSSRSPRTSRCSLTTAWICDTNEALHSTVDHRLRQTR